MFADVMRDVTLSNVPVPSAGSSHAVHLGDWDIAHAHAHESGGVSQSSTHARALDSSALRDSLRGLQGAIAGVETGVHTEIDDLQRSWQRLSHSGGGSTSRSDAHRTGVGRGSVGGGAGSLRRSVRESTMHTSGRTTTTAHGNGNSPRPASTHVAPDGTHGPRHVRWGDAAPDALQMSDLDVSQQQQRTHAIYARTPYRGNQQAPMGQSASLSSTGSGASLTTRIPNSVRGRGADSRGPELKSCLRKNPQTAEAVQIAANSLRALKVRPPDLFTHNTLLVLPCGIAQPCDVQ